MLVFSRSSGAYLGGPCACPLGGEKIKLIKHVFALYSLPIIFSKNFLARYTRSIAFYHPLRNANMQCALPTPFVFLAALATGKKRMCACDFTLNLSTLQPPHSRPMPPPTAAPCHRLITSNYRAVGHCAGRDLRISRHNTTCTRHSGTHF